jgi:O-antigen ligase
MLVESFMSGEVWLTTYLIMQIPLCFALGLLEKRPAAKFFLWLTTGLATSCLLLTYSRAGLLALICEVGVLAWVFRRRSVVLGAAGYILAVLIGGALLFQYDITVRGGWKASSKASIPMADARTLGIRQEIWIFAMERLRDHWVVGMGYGKDSLKMASGGKPGVGQGPQPQPSKFLGAHNTFLDLALGVGVPGLALFIWMMLRLARVALTRFHRLEDPMTKALVLGMGASIIGLAVRLFFDHMFIGTLALHFWVLAAITMAACRPADIRAHGSKGSAFLDWGRRNR